MTGDIAADGAGVYNDGGTTVATGATVTGNSASDTGGGLLNHGGTTTLTSSVVSGNDAASAAGVGTYHYGTSTLNNCTVSGNSASGSGGGLSTNYSTTLLTSCAVSGDTAANGGGLYTVNHGTASATNSTVSGNTAETDGGGLYTATGGKTTLADATISGNSAGVSGGGLYNQTGTVTLGNTIVAVNMAGTSGPDALGTVSSLGNNLVGETDGSSGWVAADLTGTGAQPLNPLLSPLGNYGGPTDTMALLPGSPAINAGSNALIPGGVTTDQRVSPASSAPSWTSVPSSRTCSPSPSPREAASRRHSRRASPTRWWRRSPRTTRSSRWPAAWSRSPRRRAAHRRRWSETRPRSAPTGTVSVAATANAIVGGYTVPAGAQRYHEYRGLQPDQPGDPDDHHDAEHDRGHAGVVAR